MTDLEICKRIAEIEGISDYIFINYDYNPLTDKALCFDLMVKHKVDTEWWGDELGAYIPVNDGEIHDKNPQKAICLAIIEAHKG
tara:strand:+ start:740 stop:991 length:252 start_codon:yes stop_codon:yes gene_type:complete